MSMHVRTGQVSRTDTGGQGKCPYFLGESICVRERDRETWLLLGALAESATDTSSLPPKDEHLPQLSLFELVYEQHSPLRPAKFSCEFVIAEVNETSCISAMFKGINMATKAFVLGRCTWNQNCITCSMKITACLPSNWIDLLIS